MLKRAFLCLHSECSSWTDAGFPLLHNINHIWSALSFMSTFQGKMYFEDSSCFQCQHPYSSTHLAPPTSFHPPRSIHLVSSTSFHPPRSIHLVPSTSFHPPPAIHLLPLMLEISLLLLACERWNISCYHFFKINCASRM